MSPRTGTAPADASATTQAAAKPPVGVLDRALLVLGCFDTERPSLHLREIAARTGLDKATVLRILGAFTVNGYVQRLDDGRYAPGPAVLRLASVYNAVSDVSARMTLVLRRVVEQMRESAAFYTRNGDDRICVARANAHRAIRYHVEIGHGVRLASGGAAAHVLLAYTGGATHRAADLLRQGYVSTAAEREPELASVAMPVFEADGSFLGALVVSCPLTRQSDEIWARARAVAAGELRANGFRCATPDAASIGTAAAASSGTAEPRSFPRLAARSTAAPDPSNGDAGDGRGRTSG